MTLTEEQKQELRAFYRQLEIDDDAAFMREVCAVNAAIATGAKVYMFWRDRPGFKQDRGRWRITHIVWEKREEAPGHMYWYATRKGHPSCENDLQWLHTLEQAGVTPDPHLDHWREILKRQRP